MYVRKLRELTAMNISFVVEKYGRTMPSIRQKRAPRGTGWVTGDLTGRGFGSHHSPRSHTRVCTCTTGLSTVQNVNTPVQQQARQIQRSTMCARGSKQRNT